MIFKLFKIFSSNIFSFASFFDGFKKGPKGIIKSILLGLLFVYLLGAFVAFYTMTMISTYRALAGAGNTQVMPLFAMVTGLIVIFVFGFTSVASNYYTGPSEEQFIAMPLSTSQLFGAKFAVSCVTDAIMGIILFSIAAVVYGLNEGLLSNPMFYLGTLTVNIAFSVTAVAVIYLLIILVLLLVPALRKKSFLNLISSVFVILIAIAYGFCSSRISMNFSSSNPELEQAMVPMINSIAGLAEAVPFLKFIAGALNGKPLAIIFLLAEIALLLFVCIPLMGKMYIKSLTGFSDTKAKKLSDEMVEKVITKDVRSASIFHAVYWRDVRTVLREPTFFANGPLMVFLMPIIFLVSMAFGFISMGEGGLMEFRQEIVKSFREVSPEDITKMKYYVSVALSALAIFTGNASSIAASSFSREGKAMYDLKAMPIQNNLIAKAKFWHAYTYIVIGCINITVLFVIANTVLGSLFNFTESLKILFLMFLNTSAVSLVLIFIDMFIDTVHPKLQWENPIAAFKQNLNSIIAVFLSIGFDGLAVVLAIFLLPKNTVGQILFTVIFGIIAAPIGAGYFKYAEKKISLM